MLIGANDHVPVLKKAMAHQALTVDDVQDASLLDVLSFSVPCNSNALGVTRVAESVELDTACAFEVVRCHPELEDSQAIAQSNKVSIQCTTRFIDLLLLC